MAYMKFKELTKYFDFYKELDKGELPEYTTEYVRDYEKILLGYKTFDNDSNVTIYEVDTYKHNYISLVLSFFKFRTISKVVKILKESDICYVPFGLIWAPLIYPKLKNHCKLITTIHDPHPHNPKSIIEQIAAKIDYYTNGLADSIVLLNKRDFLFVKNRYPNLPITIIPHANFDYYTHLSGLK